MLTDAKIEANQANALRSTGPKTEAGKAISSRNALRHGLTATTALLPDEDPAEFQSLLDAMLRDFNPYDATESSLIYELADCQWRLRRAGRYEAKILSADIPDFKALNNMSLHAARIKRQFSATLKELETRHAANSEARVAQLKRAETISRADRILHRPSTLAEHGFDFTLEYLKRWCARNDAFKYADEVVDENEDYDDPAEIDDVPEAA